MTAQPPSSWSRWDVGFAHLLAHVETTGSAHVPQRAYSPDGFWLGKWVHNKRQRRDTLTPVQQDLLAALPGWRWNAADAPHDPTPRSWDTNAARLRASTGPLSPDLRAWAERQRRERGHLSPAQRQALESVPGWDWTVRDATAAPFSRWVTRFITLYRWQEQHGLARIPQRAVFEQQPIGEWAHQQRAAHRRGTLHLWRTRLLEALPGWSWQPRQGDWASAYAKLQAFAAVHGHANPPAAYRTDDAFPLGAWAARQRRAPLTPAQRAALLNLPGWRFGTRATFTVEDLADWLTGLGGVRLPLPRHPDWGDVSRRVKSLRGHRETLTPADREHLERVPGWQWRDPAPERADRWITVYDATRRYLATHGAPIPESYRDPTTGVLLAAWLRTQRRRENPAHPRHTLHPDRVTLLEQLPGWRW